MEYLLLLPRLEPRYLSRPSRGLVTKPTALITALYLTADQEVVAVLLGKASSSFTKRYGGRELGHERNSSQHEYDE